MNRNDVKSKTITVNQVVIFRILLIAIGFLATASLAGQIMKFVFGHPNVFGLVPLFNLNGEENIPASFSTILLLSSSCLLALIAKMEKLIEAKKIYYWVILSIGFFIMAVDELFSFHERLAEPVRNLLFPGQAGFFYFAWVIPGIIIVLIFTIFFLGFIKELDARTRDSFVFAAFLFIGGSIGFEMVGGYYLEINQKNDLYLQLIVTMEESLEMMGVVVFIRGLLNYLADKHEAVKFYFSKRFE